MQQPREPEVEHLDALAAALSLLAREEQVLGLQVAVHHPALVGGLEHAQHLLGDLEELALTDGALALEPVLQRLALEQLHDQVRRPLVRAARDDVVVQHLDHARMLDLVGRVPLPPEALEHLLVPRQLGVKHLDGGARAVAVASGIHGSHAAHAEQSLEGPLVVEDFAHTGQRFGVRFVAQGAIPWNCRSVGRVLVAS